MSRIGRKPIAVPSGVDIKVEDGLVTVNGPKGVLTQDISTDMTIVMEEGNLLVQRPSDGKTHRSLHGLTRALIANMVEGVTNGYEKKLEMIGVGYRAQMQGSKLVINIGFSHPVEVDPPEGINFEVPAPTKISVKGINKQQVGDVAARIREIRKPEPYKGKGIRYEGEKVRRKAGKSGK
ncbi:MAG: 50S ribosomal protein L6 [Methylocystaceae bacterium]